MNPLHVILGLGMVLTAVVTAGWLFWRGLKKSDDPARMLFYWGLSAVLIAGGFFAIYKWGEDGSTEGKTAGLMLGLVLGLVLAVIWAPRIGAKVGDWFSSLYTGGSEPPVDTPAYSIAESRRKQGRYQEALWEIRNQLARFPTDVPGQLMQAEIQAEHLNDLPGAQVTIDRFVAQPGHGPKNIAYALNSLADWHLKLAEDIESARAAVQRIVDLLPGTEQAMQASQRLAHLEHPEELHAARERKLLQLRPGATNVGLRQDSAALRPAGESAEQAAERLSRQLEAHPLDTEAREKLAVLYAEEFGRLDLATEQFEELIATSNTQGRDVARWLNELADAQVRHGADYDTVRATLQRIIDRFPGLAAERLAQQRIEHLRLEIKGREHAQAVKMGTYEKDLGLKMRRKG